MNDPIVDEVRRVRDAHAARFNYDLEAIFQDIKQKEKQSGRIYVSFADDTIATNETPQPTGAGVPQLNETERLHPAPVVACHD